MTPYCRHCSLRKVTRPKGLCWKCYYEPHIVRQYPSTSKFANRGVMLGNRTPPPPPAPTHARPGSPEKVAVLEARNGAGYGLWHPADNFDAAG